MPDRKYCKWHLRSNSLRSAASCCALCWAARCPQPGRPAGDTSPSASRREPGYYERMPDLSGRTSWSQLDTTLCRGAGPRKGRRPSAGPAGQYRHPGAARRACNAVRTAATRPHTHRTAPPGLRQPSSSTKPWRRWKRAMQAQPCTSELEQYYRQAGISGPLRGRKPVARASQPEDRRRAAPEAGASQAGMGQVRAPLAPFARSGSAGRTAGSRNGTARKETRRIARSRGRRTQPDAPHRLRGAGPAAGHAGAGPALPLDGDGKMKQKLIFRSSASACHRR